jgi:formate dehydrogenase gamma subunit
MEGAFEAMWSMVEAFALGELLLEPEVVVRDEHCQDAFSAFSEAAKYAHDFMSFPFVIGIALIAALWLKDNIPEAIDLEWFKQGGGFIRSKHPPARRFNAGEKLVFWLALSAGVAVSASGYLLLFPFYATSIIGMQIANVIHSVGAILFIALILGHIYIGTIGMEGAFEAMWTGGRFQLGQGAPQPLARGGAHQGRKPRPCSALVFEPGGVRDKVLLASPSPRPAPKAAGAH